MTKTLKIVAAWANRKELNWEPKLVADIKITIAHRDFRDRAFTRKSIICSLIFQLISET